MLTANMRGYNLACTLVVSYRTKLRLYYTTPRMQKTK